MQFTQLPKISLTFKKVCYQQPASEINLLNIKFKDLIPEKISKQVNRMNRAQLKENASEINLRDGNVLKISSLLNVKSDAKAKKQSDESRLQIFTPHSLRKLRIESSIQAEIINFFSSAFVPKILRNEYALWIIDAVN